MQRKVIITAFKGGYYEYPKKASVKELADAIGIRGSTFVTYRRKAERRILEELITKRLQRDK